MKTYYIYKLVEKFGGKFYIGLRGCDVRYTENDFLDLGIKYFTSSKYVKEIGFNNFNLQILHKNIETPEEAFWMEQEIISQHIHSPLCLNRQVYDKERSGVVFYTGGKKLSNEHRKKISDGANPRPKTKEQIESLANRNRIAKLKRMEEYDNTPNQCPYCQIKLEYDERHKKFCGKIECKNSHRKTYNNKEVSEETKEKMRKPKTNEHRNKLKAPKSKEHVQNTVRSNILNRILFILDNSSGLGEHVK